MRKFVIDPYVTTKGGVVILNGPFNIEEARRVASLCKAAPDLLAACEWAARSYHHPACGLARGKSPTCSCHVGAAQAAIAKAEKSE